MLPTSQASHPAARARVTRARALPALSVTVVLVLSGLAVSTVRAAEAPVIVVTSTTDEASSEDGATSLREAILQANATPGPERIVFDVTEEPVEGRAEIALTELLPAITSPLGIVGDVDGNGVGDVRLVDGAPGGLSVALQLAEGADGTVVSHLELDGFDQDAIDVDLGGASGATARITGAEVVIGPDAEVSFPRLLSLRSPATVTVEDSHLRDVRVGFGTVFDGELVLSGSTTAVNRGSRDALTLHGGVTRVEGSDLSGQVFVGQGADLTLTRTSVSASGPAVRSEFGRVRLESSNLAGTGVALVFVDRPVEARTRPGAAARSVSPSGFGLSSDGRNTYSAGEGNTPIRVEVETADAHVGLLDSPRQSLARVEVGGVPVSAAGEVVELVVTSTETSDEEFCTGPGTMRERAVVDVVLDATGGGVFDVPLDTDGMFEGETLRAFVNAPVTAGGGDLLPVLSACGTSGPVVPDPDPSASVTDDPSPSVTDDPSPSVTDDPSPSVTDDPSPSVTDDPSPSVTDDPSPSVDPSPTASATGDPGPDDVAWATAIELESGLRTLRASLPSLLGAFDLSADRAVVTRLLAQLYRLDEAATIALLELPLVDTDEIDPATVTLQELADHVRAQDCAVVTPSEPGGRILEATCERSLDLTADPVVGALGADPNLLQDLGGAAGLGLADAWDGRLDLTLTLGVDAPDEEPLFYLAQSSEAVLQVSGTRVLTPAAGAAYPVSGAVEADLAATLRPTAPEGTRLRFADLATPPTVTVAGSAAADVTLGIPDGSLRWQAAWGLSGAQASLTSESLRGTLELPAFAGDGDTPVVDLVGTHLASGWRIVGGLASGETAPLRFAGQRLTRLDVDLLATDTGVTGDVLSRLLVAVGDTTVPVDLGLQLLENSYLATGEASIEDLALFDGAVVLSDTTLRAAGSVAHGTGATAFGADLVGGRLTTLDGAVVVDGFEVELGGDGTFTVDADEVELSLGGGAVVLELGELTLSLGPDASGPLFSAASVTGRIPALAGLVVTATDLVVRRSGRFEVGSVSAVLDDLPDLTLGGLLPFTLDSLEITIDPDTFDVDLEVTGGFDLSVLDGLPFVPVLQVGDEQVSELANDFSFGAVIEGGLLLPTDLGEITLGWTDLELGGATIDGEVRFGGIEGGVPVLDLGGGFSVQAPGFPGGGIDLDLVGSLPEVVGDPLELSGELSLPSLDFDAFSLTGLSGSGGLSIRLTDGLLDLRPTLGGIAVDRLEVPFGDLLTATAADVRVNLLPGPGLPLVSFGDGGLGLRFDDIDVLAGWGGTISNFAIGPDFAPYALPGFAVDVEVPDGFGLGLPDWLPFEVDEVGFGLSLADLEGALPGAFEITDPADFTLRFSGGLNVVRGESGELLFPVDATVSGLELDLGRLVRGEFPVTNLEGLGLGVAPFELGGLVIGGSLELGTLDVDTPSGVETVLYGRVGGTFAMDGIGAGIDLVITEFGPVIAEVMAPAGIPLDPSGLVLASVRGGLLFGAGALPDPDEDDPAALLSMPEFDEFGDRQITRETIVDLVRPAVAARVPTWETGAQLSVTGTLTHLAAPVVTGDVTLGAAYGADGDLDVLMKGDVSVYGLPFGAAGIRMVLVGPQAPALQFAFASPPPGSPIGFLMPVEATFAGFLSSQGLAEGTVAALRVVVDRVLAGTLQEGAEAIDAALGSLALSLDADRLAALGNGAQVRPLTRLVLDTDASGALTPGEKAVPVTGARLLARLVALLPADPAAVTPERAGLLATAVLAELSAASADPESASGAGAAAADLLLQLADVVREAVLDAGDAFLDVADPVLAIDGAIQPQVLGIPLGGPTDEVGLRIRKDGVSLRLTTSLNAIVNRTLESSTLGLASIYTRTLGSILTDRVTVIARFPVESALRALLDGGGYPAQGAASSEWGVTVEGSMGIFGMQMAELSGLLVPPGADDFIADHTQPLYDGKTFDPADSARPTPILEREHEANLLAAGGLLLTGNLRAPRLLTDPVGLLADLEIKAPSDPLGLPAFLDALGRELAREESPGLVQMYLPPPDEADRAHLAGLWDAKVLSLPVSDGRLDLDAEGLRVRGGVPLLGAEATFTVDAPVATTDGGSGLPRVSAAVTLDSDDAARTLADLGVPASMIPKDLAEVRVRAFSPGFDPQAVLADGSPDLLRRTGGLEVLAQLAVPGLVDSAEARLVVTLGPDGLPTSVVGEASISNAGFGPVGISSARLRFSVGSGPASVSVSGSGSVFGTTVGVSGSLDSRGFGSLSLSLASTGMDLGGFRLRGSLVAVRDASGARVAVDGTVTVPTWLADAGGVGSVSVTGSIASSGDASLVLGLRDLTFGQLRLRGTLGLVLTRGVATVSVTGGTVRLPGTDRDVTISGSLSSQGLGSLTVGTTGALRFTGRPFTVGGSFTLARELVGGSVRTRLRASNATFGWDDIGTFTATLFEIASDGSAAVTLPSRTLALGGGGALSLGSLQFAMGAGASNPRLAIGESRLTLPGLAERECLRENLLGLCQSFGADRRLVLPAFELTTADFTRTLLDGSLDLGGLVSVSGRLQVRKVGDVWSVQVLAPSGGGSAEVRLGTLATVPVNAMSIASDGSFEVDVAVPSIGTEQLALRGSSFRMVRTAGFDGVLTLTATGGRLVAPMGTIATFPTLTMTSSLTIDRTVRFGLDLGPALRVSAADYRFRLGSDGVLRLNLLTPTAARPSVTALAGSAGATLHSLDLRSSGTFDLDVEGRIAFFGFRIVEVRMDADLRDGVLRLDVDSRINLGFESLRVEGWWDSTGDFRLTGGFDASVGVCPAGCLSGGIEVTIDSEDSISGDFDGRVCLFGGCADARGSMSASGRVTGVVRIGSVRHDFDFQIGNAPPDTIRPTFSPNPPPDVTVNQDVAGGEGRVSYVLPSATDRRDSTSASFAAHVSCSPAPGSVFPVGTTTVSCTARDAADNTRSTSFRLTLVDSTPDAPLVPLVLAGDTSRTGGGGYAGSSGFTVTLFSKPRVLLRGTVPDDGVVDVAVRVPPSLPPGVHTLVVSGTAPDGGVLVHATRIRVGGAVEPRLVLRTRPRTVGGKLSVPEAGCLDRARVALVRIRRGREVVVDRTRVRLVARTGGRSATYGMPRPSARGAYRVELRRSDCEAVSKVVRLERFRPRSARSSTIGGAQETST